MRLVDADEAITTLEGLTELVHGEGAALTKALIFAALKSESIIPTAYRKSGHWTMVDGPDNANNITCECSECKRRDIFASNQAVPFCWHCGTKMCFVNDGRCEGNAVD